MSVDGAPSGPAQDLISHQDTCSVAPCLDGVPETMLWSLHHRACEARRPDGVIVDPESVRIESTIDYDFKNSFGEPRGLLAARAAEIDRALRAWLERNPDGVIVSLGEGLETQGRRVDNGRMRWVSVDLPDAIRLRERFLLPTHRFHHIAGSALDIAWMDEVDTSSGVFIIAQGLLMYLDPERVRELFAAIADRFPGADIVFDSIPRWFSDLTLLGLNQTASYTLPPMPWGIDRDELEPTLRRWHAGVLNVAFLPYCSPRGFGRLLAELTDKIPVARHGVPSLVHVKIASSVKATETAEKVLEKALSEQVSPLSPLTGDMLMEAAIGGLMTAAAQSVLCGAEIATAITKLIGKRVALQVALGMAAYCPDPAALSKLQAGVALTWFGRAEPD